MPNADHATEDQAREAILALLAERDPGKTICPSEAARTLAGDGDFRPYMEPVREAAGRLADEGKVEVTQKGRRVDVATGRDTEAQVPHPAFNLDTAQARASIRKLAALNPSVVWAGHGLPVTADVVGQLERAAAG